MSSRRDGDAVPVSEMQSDAMPKPPGTLKSSSAPVRVAQEAPRPGIPAGATDQQQDQQRSAILADAGVCQAAAPDLMADAGIINALVLFITAAQQQLEAATQQLNTLNNELAHMRAIMNNGFGLHPVTVQHMSALEEQLQQQEHQVAAASANVSAGNVLVHRIRRQSDKMAVGVSYKYLTMILPGNMSLKLGDTMSPEQVADLNRQQMTAYSAYANDLAIVGADIAVFNKSYAQWQLYASNPRKYGNIARDALDAVNQAVRSMNVYFTEDAIPPAIDVKTAQQNLDRADRKSVV